MTSEKSYSNQGKFRALAQRLEQQTHNLLSWVQTQDAKRLIYTPLLGGVFCLIILLQKRILGSIWNNNVEDDIVWVYDMLEDIIADFTETILAVPEFYSF